MDVFFVSHLKETKCIVALHTFHRRSKGWQERRENHRNGSLFRHRFDLGFLAARRFAFHRRLVAWETKAKLRLGEENFRRGPTLLRKRKDAQTAKQCHGLRRIFSARFFGVPKKNGDGSTGRQGGIAGRKQRDKLTKRNFRFAVPPDDAQKVHPARRRLNLLRRRSPNHTKLRLATQNLVEKLLGLKQLTGVREQRSPTHEQAGIHFALRHQTHHLLVLIISDQAEQPRRAIKTDCQTRKHRLIQTFALRQRVVG